MLLEASDAGAKGEMAWAGTSNSEDITRVGARSMGMPFSEDITCLFFCPLENPKTSFIKIVSQFSYRFFFMK